MRCYLCRIIEWVHDISDYFNSSTALYKFSFIPLKCMQQMIFSDQGLQYAMWDCIFIKNLQDNSCHIKERTITLVLLIWIAMEQPMLATRWVQQSGCFPHLNRELGRKHELELIHSKQSQWKCWKLHWSSENAQGCRYDLLHKKCVFFQ